MSDGEMIGCAFAIITAVCLYGIIGALIGMAIDVMDNKVLFSCIFFMADNASNIFSNMSGKNHKKDLVLKGELAMNRDLSKFEPPKAEPDGLTKELFGIPVKFEKDSVEKLREMCTIPDDIKEKLVDIYNYMVINRNSRIELRFDTGIKFICEVNDSEWKSLPRINLDDVLRGGK